MEGYNKNVQSSGCIIYEKENKLYIMEQPKRWIAIAIFVFLILSVIFFGFGLFQIIASVISSNGIIQIGLIFTGIGIVTIILLLMLFNIKKQDENIPPEKLKCLCIIDLNDNLLLDSNQNTLAQLASVKTERIFQMTSSSPALAINWPGGSITVAKGNPFIGGIAPIEEILRNKGIKS